MFTGICIIPPNSCFFVKLVPIFDFTDIEFMAANEIYAAVYPSLSTLSCYRLLTSLA